MSRNDIPQIDAADLERLLSPAAAVQVISAALRDGIDPTRDPDRIIIDVCKGQLLLMPGEVAERVGIKIISSAPGNDGTRLPRIQGTFILFDGATLEPILFIDGIALTTVRTPAVSISGVLPVLTRATTPLKVVVFGTGTQARAHVRTVAESLVGVRPLDSVTYVSRQQAARSATGTCELPSTTVQIGSVYMNEALAEADLVVCATPSAVPLFESSVLKNECVVIAVGSHEPDRRELDGALLGRGQVIVEDISTALREAGDVILAIDAGILVKENLIEMRSVVCGDHILTADRPVIFKTTGMAWEDLVIASHVEILAHQVDSERAGILEESGDRQSR
ncbi:MAG: ornithine cyclodeaminase family protein [Gordonia sp. (in: high G+C Gram-positive bacteria)]